MNLKQEFIKGSEAGYTLYDVWYICHPIFVEAVRNLYLYYPEEFNKYLQNNFADIRKLTSFTNPDTIAAKEHLERDGILTLKRGDIIKIRKTGSVFVLEVKNYKGKQYELTADLVVNTLGSDNLINLLRSNTLIQSLLECGAVFNQSRTGLKTDKNQQASEGLYVIGSLAFGGNLHHLNYALRYTHLKAIVHEAFTVGTALTNRLIQQSVNKLSPNLEIPSWECCLKAVKTRNNEWIANLTDDNRLIGYTNHFYVIVGWGAFVPGYLLIMPKDNQYCSFGALPREYFSEAQWLITSLAKLIKKIYNKIINQFYQTSNISYVGVIIFEHGMSPGKPGCACTKQAHVHLMIEPSEEHIQKALFWYNLSQQKSKHSFLKNSPTQAEIISQVISSRISENNLLDIQLDIHDLERFQNYSSMGANFDNFPECTLAIVERKQPYVYFYPQKQQNRFLIPAIFTNKFMPQKLSTYLDKMELKNQIPEIFLGSQLGRQIVAKMWGIEDRYWNWQDYAGYKNMQRTILDLSRELIKISEQPEAEIFGYQCCIF